MVHLISGLMYGGGQKVALDLLDGFQASHDVKGELWLLGCRHDALRKHATFIAEYGGDYSSPMKVLAAANLVRARLLDNRVNIVHSHGWDADVIAYLATIGRPEARVVHLHTTPSWVLSQRARHRIRRLITERIFSGSNTRVLAVAAAVLNHWAQAFKALRGKAEVVSNSVDMTRFGPSELVRNSNTASLTFGVACRLVPEKGLSSLLHALPAVVSRFSNFVLKIAGDGPQRHSLECLTEELRIEQHVVFLGHVTDIAQFYRSLDIFVLPSTSEGMPLTVLEAMASGLPSIVTNVGGTTEIIRQGIDGLVVDPGSPPALSAAMIAMIESPDRRLEMGKSAADRALRAFSRSHQVDAVTQAYLGLRCLSAAERTSDETSQESNCATKQSELCR